MLKLDKYSLIQLQEFVMRAKEQGLCFKDKTEINPVVEMIILDVLRDALSDVKEIKEVG